MERNVHHLSPVRSGSSSTVYKTNPMDRNHPSPEARAGWCLRPNALEFTGGALRPDAPEITHYLNPARAGALRPDALVVPRITREARDQEVGSV